MPIRVKGPISPSPIQQLGHAVRTYANERMAENPRLCGTIFDVCPQCGYLCCHALADSPAICAQCQTSTVHVEIRFPVKE